MSAAALGFFARHEARLAWRDWLAMMQGGRRRRRGLVALALLLFLGALHFVAHSLLAPYAALLTGDKASLLIVTGWLLLSWGLLFSQSLESITRAFYARADLPLLLSSPASSRAMFIVRILAIAAASAGMSMLLLGPVVNALAILGGAKFLTGYGLIVAMSFSATGVAAIAAALLFRFIGAGATRLTSQIVAAVAGAGFVIVVQAIAILAYGDPSRIAVFRAPALVAAAPGPEGWIWLPAWAAIGDARAMADVLALSSVLLVAAAAAISGGFSRHAVAAAGLFRASGRAASASRALTPLAPAAALRRKEWMLLARDPWLLSQTLMQLLYLAPPALLLWRSYGADSGLIVLAPALVMAAGQLAGGLAWLAISGEDAPDLVATAPAPPSAIMRAKVEAVAVAVAAPLAPLVLALAFAAPFVALVTLIGAALACAGATAIQVFFRAQARRTNFRRRQTSSRVATFAEAFSSIALAAAAGLAAAGSWTAIAPALLAGAVVWLARALATEKS